MATYSVRLFKNTGFDLNNIPETYSILNQSDHIDVDAVWLYQDKIQAKIRVKINYNDVSAVDYMAFTNPQHTIYNSVYFVTNIAMLNPLTCELDLVLDTITTVSIAKIATNLAGGWCTRKHVTDDTLFNNNIEENFIPAEPLEIDYSQMGVTNGLDTTIIASSVDLDKFGLVAKTFKDLDNELSVSVPQLPTNKEGTIISIEPSLNSKTYTKVIPNTRLYVVNRNPEYYSNVLAMIWSLGMIDSISAIYRIPGLSDINYDNNIEQEYYHNVIKNGDNRTSGAVLSCSLLAGGFSTDSGIPQKWTSGVQNNKVFSDQFNNVTVSSYSSGDSLDFNASDIKVLGEDNFQFYFWYDPAPNGRSYIRPMNFQGLTGNDNDIFFQITNGSIWPNNQVLFLNREGWNITKKMRGLEIEQQGYNSFFNAMQGLINIAKLPASTSTRNISGMVNTHYNPSMPFNDFDNPQSFGKSSIPTISNGFINNIQQGLNQNINKRETSINYALNTGLTSPTIKFPVDNSIIELIGNGFNILRTRLSINDTNRFDRYLTEFGYAVNEPMSYDVFFGRKYFNYVKCSDLSITPIDGIPTYIISNAIERLESGVRIWHTPVNKAAYNSNPIE